MPNNAVGCVAHYKMEDNAASTVVVDSVGANNGTAQQNTSLMHADGQVNGGLAFNGSTDYIDTNDSFESTFQSDFSISVWIKPDDGVLPLGTTQNIFGIDSTSTTNDKILIFGVIDSVIAAYKVGGVSRSTPIIGLLKDGQEIWHHVVVVCKQNSPSLITLSLYFDGIFKISNTLPDVLMSDWRSPGNTVFIGQNCVNAAPVSAKYFDGSIDDVMIFNRALTADEVKTLYNGGSGTTQLGDLNGVESGKRIRDRTFRKQL